MNEITRKLLEQIDKEHDWKEGRVYSQGGTRLCRTDVCRVCGLERCWVDDSQNYIHDEYTFVFDESEIPLREAAARKCLSE